jgi:hypothetical protein
MLQVVLPTKENKPGEREAVGENNPRKNRKRKHRQRPRELLISAMSKQGDNFCPVGEVEECFTNPVNL